MNKSQKEILITGCAGFIGSALAIKCLQNGFNVVGIDNINNYYNQNLKLKRLENIKYASTKSESNFSFYKISLEDLKSLKGVFNKHDTKIVVNLAAQAGVRYSIENPSSYLQSNIIGFGNLLEECRRKGIENLIYASSSSVYGGNKSLPFSEKDAVDHPVSIYAATKKSNELMAHTYSHIYNLPCTGLRFFTVYGPWGRPDMAPMIFTKSILRGDPISVNNFGKMRRDFTYVDDIVEGVYRCCQKPSVSLTCFDPKIPNPSASLAPYRIFNIGNNRPVELLYFINLLEKKIGKKANMKFVPLPPGDVVETAADINLLENWIGFKPSTSIEEGVEKFLSWYFEFYGI